MEEEEKDKKEETGCLLLYGEVGDDDDDGKLSSKEFVEKLMDMDGRCRRIEIHINSIGGEVYPGIAIFNAIRNCRSDVTLYIDGIAASIAGVIALCGRRVEMSRYAQLMLHSVSGGCYGNKQDLREMIDSIEKLEDMIASIIANRCGRKKDDVTAEYFDGKDHWISAEDALRMGMADRIYDVEADVPEGSTTDDIYRIFTNRLDRLQPKTDHKDQEKEMKLEELKKVPCFANCASEDEVLKSAQATADRAEALEKENAELKKEADELKRAAQEQQEQRISDAVEAAVTDGRIPAAQKDTYTNILRADFANGTAALKAMRPKRMVRNELNETPAPAGTGTWEKRMDGIRNRYDRKN